MIEKEERLKGGTEMDWCKVLTWIAVTCAIAAMIFRTFLPRIAVAVLVFVGITIIVALVIHLLDKLGKE